MNDAGQTAVDQARREYDMARSTAIALVRGSSDRARAEKTADAAFDHLTGAIREADPRREAVETALAAALDLFNWQDADRGNGLWCGDDFATGDVDANGRQIYVECDYEHQCGDCIRLNALDAALKAVEQASLSDAGAIREADPRREAVETALAPFARMAELFDGRRNPPMGTDDDAAIYTYHAGEDVFEITVADMRRARAALKAVEQASLSDTEEGGRA